MKRAILALLSALIVALGIAAATVPGPANASTAALRVCAQSGTGYCLNAWGGFTLGNPVKMYNNVTTNNNDYTVTPADICSGQSFVTYNPHTNTGCPFSNVNFDITYRSSDIVYIKSYYQGGGHGCAGDFDLNLGVSVADCGSTASTVVLADALGLTDCETVNAYSSNYINVYWSNQFNELAFLQSGGAVGQQAVWAPGQPQSTASCWNYNGT